jgi:hypothetical protein
MTYTRSAWQDTSLAISDYTTDKLTKALEQALYSVHTHRHTKPISHILILPKWEHTPYLARNLHSAYVSKLASISYQPSTPTTHEKHNQTLNIYLVANENALSLINNSLVTTTLRNTINEFCGVPLTTLPLDITKKDPSYLDSRHAYTSPYPPVFQPSTQSDNILIRLFQAACQPSDFICTDGSQITGNPTLGASIVDPTTKTTTHIEIKSQWERHAINRAELAAITTPLDLYKYAPILSILTDIIFNINNLRNYFSDPQNFTHHKHKDLLILADNIFHTGDNLGYTTHIGKV